VIIGALEAQKQRNIRSEGSAKTAFQAKMKINSTSSKDKKPIGESSGKGKQQETGKLSKKKGKFPPCPTCKRTNHAENDCWWKGKSQCRFCKKFGNIEKFCGQKQHQGQ